MAADANNLIWVDMEMSGLDPETEKVLEVAIVVTDTHLNTVAEGPVVVVHQSDAVLDAMDAWNKNTHAKSGLIERVKAVHADRSRRRNAGWWNSCSSTCRRACRRCAATRCIRTAASW